MCGIAGIVSADGRVNLTHVRRLWRAIEDRGTHASGMAFRRPDEESIQVVKGPFSASVAIDKGTVAHMGSSVDFVLLHTRFTTQGSTRVNANNHPVCRNGVILTHNGVISNDQAIFDDLAASGGLRKFDVDTEALVAGIAYRGLAWTAERADGSMSLAWVDTKESHSQVNWFTNGRNPLVIGRLEDDSIVWASQPHHLARLPVKDWFWASPWKHYWTAGDGRIESRWVSDRRDPACTWQCATAHSASRTYVRPKTVEPRTPVRETLSTSTLMEKPLIKGGWIYDEDADGWRKARKQDYQDALFDDDGNLL